MNIQEIEEKEKTKSLEGIKKIIEKINNPISLDELKDYYGIILGAFINKDISNKEYLNTLILLKDAKIKPFQENKNELYKQIIEVIDDQIEKCFERIIQKKYKEIKKIYQGIKTIIPAKSYIKLCEEFDYCEIKNIEGVDYIEWAEILNNLEPMCSTPDEEKRVNDYKQAISQYIEKKQNELSSQKA
jgi:uncharacterized protein YktA (UPF0223 family)